VIAVDTSALMAIVLGESQSDACMAALEAEDVVLISAGTISEALIVAAQKNVRDVVANLIEDLEIEVVPVTRATAQRVADAYARFGKGNHRAALNFGDCFAYETAKDRGCRLLYVGKDFAKTDIKSAL
jgi:ribonuclease VapC